MITVTFSEKGFEVSGHSGYAEEGSDIVCAAVSSATELTVNAITEVLKIKAKVEVDPSDALIKLTLPESISIDELQLVDIILDSYKLQMSLIAEEYSDYVLIN